ncbi:VanZ family protein [Alteromonas sp. H39]|uniref:VanZ family protein n=1 Tax=Alteromonas sp. H39 TaxID=3389876 RepID=UPI0039E19338
MIIRGLSIIAALGFFGFILWVISMANRAQPSVFFDFVASFPLGDKVGHVGLFGTLTLLVTVALGFRTLRIMNTRIYVGAMLVWLFVTVEEVSQGFIPNRTMDMGDYMADLIGILAACGLCYLLNRRRQRKQRERSIFAKERQSL